MLSIKIKGPSDVVTFPHLQLGLGFQKLRDNHNMPELVFSFNSSRSNNLETACEIERGEDPRNFGLQDRTFAKPTSSSFQRDAVAMILGSLEEHDYVKSGFQ
jgi:hypothetical protein